MTYIWSSAIWLCAVILQRDTLILDRARGVDSDQHHLKDAPPGNLRVDLHRRARCQAHDTDYVACLYLNVWMGAASGGHGEDIMTLLRVTDAQSFLEHSRVDLCERGATKQVVDVLRTSLDQHRSPLGHLVTRVAELVDLHPPHQSYEPICRRSCFRSRAAKTAAGARS
jgi:hypothetical protein